MRESGLNRGRQYPELSHIYHHEHYQSGLFKRSTPAGDTNALPRRLIDRE